MEGGNDMMKKTPLNIAEEKDSLKNKIWNENKILWMVAGPTIIIRFSMFGISVITQAFNGHIGPMELASYSLVYNVLFRFVFGILSGMTNGFVTLCGQAYGAKQYHKLGIYLQQSWILLFMAFTILSPLFIFGSRILKALGQDEDIATMARAPSFWFIPVTFVYTLLYSFIVYLQSQSNNLVLACLTTVSLAANIFLSWLLSVKYMFGVHGTRASSILSYSVANVGLLIYVMCGGCRETWKGFTTLAFKDLGPAVKLSLWSGVVLCLDFWYGPILILLAGKMGNAKVTIDALCICFNIGGWATMISFGFLSTASVRVSNELGRKDSKAAKLAVAMVLLASMTIALMLCVFILCFSRHVAYMFSESEDVIEEVARLSPLLAVSILLNGVEQVLEGMSTGAGRQGMVACVKIGSWYLIGIPLGVILANIFKLQVEGVWIGMLIGTAVQTAILVIMTCKIDWDEEVSLAQKRIHPSSIEDETYSHA